LCEGISDEIEEFAKLVEDKLRGYEFSTFSVGSRVDEDIIERDERLFREFHFLDGYDIKTWLNREIGKKIQRDIKKRFVFENPDIVAIVDTRFNHVTLQISPLFIYGRYIKRERGIPQTKWPCRACKGIGCRKCNYSGKQYKTSVEELIAKKILDETEGEDESFHGCGREDIDARMLGRGRPFVIEIKNPRRRNIDLKDLEMSINKHAKGMVEVSNLRFSNKGEVRRLKSATFPKVYQAKIVAPVDIPEEKLKEVVQSLQDVTIKQKTPLRVTHRRADKIREKRIYNCKIIYVKGKEALIEIRAESGTYIKEFVSGDNGRTKPSISDMLGVACKVMELDVVAVEGE